jgi:hypothetical protein
MLTVMYNVYFRQNKREIDIKSLKSIEGKKIKDEFMKLEFKML